MHRIWPSALRLLRPTALSEELEWRGVVSSCVSSFLALVIAGARAPEAGSPSVRKQDLLEPHEIHECRNCLDNVVCWAFVTTLHGHRRDNAPEVQYCQDVLSHLRRFKKKLVQLTHRDRCGRLGDSRVWPVWCFPTDTRHTPVSEWEVRPHCVS